MNTERQTIDDGFNRRPVTRVEVSLVKQLRIGTLPPAGHRCPPGGLPFLDSVTWVC